MIKLFCDICGQQIAIAETEERIPQRPHICSTDQPAWDNYLLWVTQTVPALVKQRKKTEQISRFGKVIIDF